ncbi:unnamed protein product, partial [Hapterophycus canaliculatus]
DAANKEVFKSRAARGLLSKDLPLASRAWAGGPAARPLHLPTQRQQQSKNKKQRGQQGQDDGGQKRPASGRNKRGPPGKDGEGNEERFGDNTKRARTSADADSNGNKESPAPAGSSDAPGKRTRDGVQQEKAADAVGAGGSGAGGGAGVEGLTAFVVNLPFTTRDAGLKDMFKDCGAEVTGTRVLSTPKGRSKGLGYVTFANEEALVKALAMDGSEVEGRSLSVQRSLPRGSRPTKKTNAAAGTGAAAPTTPGTTTTAAAAIAVGEGGAEGGREEETAAKKKKKKKEKKKTAEGDVVVFGGGAAGGGSGGTGGGIKWPVHPTTVFVRGLGMSATSDDLRMAFLGAGTVVEARVVEDKKTRETKGYGLVQFEEPEAIGKALALDGTSMCGGTAKVSRSRHPAVIVAPAPAPEAAPNTNGTAPGAAAAPSGGGADNNSSGIQRRANDWDCPNADCDNICFSFRTSCNRCGTGKDGSPPPKGFQQGGGSAAAGQPVATTLHRPRLQLGAAIRPRALRNKPPTNRTGATPAGVGAVASGEEESLRLLPRPPSPAPSKSNADFRALLNN